MDMRFVQLNPGACRTYMVGLAGAGEAALVDPVLDRLDEYLAYLKKETLRLTMVLDTHTHADHITAGPALSDLTGCEYLMHESAPAGCVTFRLKDGEKLGLAGVQAEAMHTPGHAADSVCLVLPGLLLTGDTLFLDEGGAGRDDLPGGDAGAHWDSLQKLLRLPGELMVHPAHEYRGREPSSLDNQRRSNPHLMPRSRQEFIAYVQELKLGPADWMNDIISSNYACARLPGSAWVPADVHACEVKGTLGKGANEQVVVPITPEQLRAKIGGMTEPVLLDVRDPDELTGELGHVKGVLNIPIDELDRRLLELEPFRDREIVAICRRGGRSLTAAQMLQQAGFRHVHFLDGGMTAWNKLGLPVDR